MTKHTPGPWSAHHDHGWLVVESANGDLYIKVEKGSAASKFLPDARLIATAPELLEALKRIAERCPTDEGSYLVASVGDTARAAIAKATGDFAA